MKNDKLDQYAMKILGALGTLFDPLSENYINLEEFEDDENATVFMHALATVAPAIVYTRLTNEDVEDYLAFNHMANRLVLQYAEMGSEVE